MAKNEQEDIEIPDEEDLAGLDDSTDWKSKADELQKKHREAGIRNRERTKALKDKIAELEKTPKTPEKKDEKKPDDEIMKRLENMALRIANITADDEVELFNKWTEDTGRDADAVLGNKIFQAELADIRTAKTNAAAADVKGGDGKISEEKSDPGFWLSKATKNDQGEVTFPDDLPNDFKLRAAIVEKMGESIKTKGEFYNKK